jgi:DNA-binding MarR family transcriptional regulator
MPLDDLLCFGLYSASRNLTAVYRPLLDEVGLTYPQYLVLLVLWSHDEVTVRDLVAQIQLDYGTLSPLLKRMEAAGLVTRHRRPEDERSVLIRLTPNGRDMEARTQGIDPALDAAVRLDKKEMATLRELLRRVSASCIDYLARP